MNAARAWSFLGTLGLIVAGTLYLRVDYGKIWDEFIVFLFGGVNQVATGYNSLLDAFGVIGALLVVNIVLAIGIGFFVQLIKGNPKDTFGFLNIGEGYNTLTFFLLVLLEELLARWLFLGVLSNVFTGVLAFYVLMLIGNSIWALMHISNYKKKDQSILRVLPQFIGGFFLSFIFVKYGLIMTVIAHFTFNAVLFATVKKQKVGLKDLGLILYYGMGLGIAWLLLSARGISLEDFMPWFTAKEALSPLKGFEFWDYLLVYMAVSFLFDFFVSILLFDSKTAAKEGESQNYIVVILLGPLLAIGLIYLVGWLIGVFISLIILKTLIVAIIVLLFFKSPSMSGMSRSWFSNLIPIYFLVCIISVLNFWLAIGLFSVYTLMEYIPYRLRTVPE